MKKLQSNSKEEVTVWRIYHIPIDDDMDDEEIDNWIDERIEADPNAYIYQANTDEECEDFLDAYLEGKGDNEEDYIIQEMDTHLDFNIGDIVNCAKGRVIGCITHINRQYAIIRRINASVEILYHVDLVYCHIASKEEIADKFKVWTQPK